MAGVFENLPYSNFHELNLGWLLETVKRLASQYGDLGSILDDIDSILDDLEAAINGNAAAIASLNARFQRLENGEYIENYIPALADWIDKNLITLVSRIAKFVVFGLTDTGYFFVDIPENWEFVHFGTIYDENDPNWLHLYLDY